MFKLALSLAVALAPLTAAAQSTADWPTKPIHWIVPFSAGGPADVIARSMQDRLSESLGQQVIIENRAGGHSNIGHDAVARAEPDGYTILYVVPNIVTNPSLFKIAVDPLKELAPVAQMTSQSYVLVANPAFKPKTVPEIIKAAKNGGSVTCASGGGLPTFGCLWLRSITEADIVHVPYKGNAPAMNDVMAGHSDMMIDLFNTALPQIKAGAVRPIALTGAERGEPLPELPVIAETLPGFVLVGWHGVMAPKGTPAPIIERLNAAFAHALADPAVRKRITDSYINVTHTSAAEFGKVLRDDFEKYARITREAGMQPQ